MTKITTNGSVSIGDPPTFSWSKNPQVCLSFYFLLAIDINLSELYGGIPFLLEDLIPIESTTKVGDNLDVGGAMAFSTTISKFIFFVRV